MSRLVEPSRRVHGQRRSAQRAARYGAARRGAARLAALCRACALAGSAWLAHASWAPPPAAPAADSTALALNNERSRPRFHPELGDFDISCLTPEELAAVRADSDNDGRTNLEELMMGMD
ncbi:MAG: hypothetical protein AB7Q17_00775, partial [Phycisphaerae bacterium]